MKEMVFINGNAALCGCSALSSDGGGDYSDSVTISFCEMHSKLLGNHANFDDEFEIAKSGEWKKPQQEK